MEQKPTIENMQWLLKRKLLNRMGKKVVMSMLTDDESTVIPN